jgi:hypothetical protein
MSMGYLSNFCNLLDLLFISVSILLLVVRLHIWLISSWHNFHRSYTFRHLSISSGLSYLLGLRFSKYSLMIDCISLIFVVVAPFSSLLLLIWVLSFLLWVSLAKGLSILFIFSKNQHFVLMKQVFELFFQSPIISSLILIITFHLLLLDLTFLVFLRTWEATLGH